MQSEAECACKTDDESPVTGDSQSLSQACAVELLLSGAPVRVMERRGCCANQGRRQMLQAHAGESKWPRCTLAYAPPEIVVAAKANREVVVSTKQDVWALGVIAYEAIVGSFTLATLNAVIDCATGVAPYPWELPVEAQVAAWRRSRLRAIMAPCLARNPASRPPAAALLAALRSIGHVTMQSET